MDLNLISIVESVDETIRKVDLVVRNVEKQLKEIIEHPSKEVYQEILRSIAMEQECNQIVTNLVLTGKPTENADSINLIPITKDADKSKNVNNLSDVEDHISLSDSLLYNELDETYNSIISGSKRDKINSNLILQRDQPQKVDHKNDDFVPDTKKCTFINNNTELSRMKDVGNNSNRTLKKSLKNKDVKSSAISCNNTNLILTNTNVSLNMHKYKQNEIDGKNSMLTDTNDDSCNSAHFKHLVPYSDAIKSTSISGNSIDILNLHENKENDQIKINNKVVIIQNNLTHKSNNFNIFKNLTNSSITTETYENYSCEVLDVEIDETGDTNANLCDHLNILSKSNAPVIDQSPQINKDSSLFNNCCNRTLFQSATFTPESVCNAVHVNCEPVCDKSTSENSFRTVKLANDEPLSKDNDESRSRNSVNVINVDDDDLTTVKEEITEKFVITATNELDKPAALVVSEIVLVDDDSEDALESNDCLDRQNHKSNVTTVDLTEDDSNLSTDYENRLNIEKTNQGIKEENIFISPDVNPERSVTPIPESAVEILVEIDDDSNHSIGIESFLNEQSRKIGYWIKEENTSISLDEDNERTEKQKYESNVEIINLSDDDDLSTDAQSYCERRQSTENAVKAAVEQNSNSHLEIINLSDDSNLSTDDTQSSCGHQQSIENTNNRIKVENISILADEDNEGTAEAIPENHVEIINLSDDSDISTDIQPSCGHQQSTENTSSRIKVENISIFLDEDNKGAAEENRENHVEIIDLSDDSNISTDIQPSCGHQRSTENTNNRIKVENISILVDEDNEGTAEANPENHVEIINLSDDSDISTDIQPLCGNQQSTENNGNEIKLENISILLDADDVHTDTQPSSESQQITENNGNRTKEKNISILLDHDNEEIVEPSPDINVEIINLLADDSDCSADTEPSENQQGTENAVHIVLDHDNNHTGEQKIFNLVSNNGNLSTNAKLSFEKKQDRENTPTITALVKGIQQRSPLKHLNLDDSSKLETNAKITAFGNDGSTHFLVDLPHRKEEKISSNSENIVLIDTKKLDDSNCTQVIQDCSAKSAKNSSSLTENNNNHHFKSTNNENLSKVYTENCVNFLKRPHDVIGDENQSNNVKKPKISNNFTITITQEVTNYQPENDINESNESVPEPFENVEESSVNSTDSNEQHYLLCKVVEKPTIAINQNRIVEKKTTNQQVLSTENCDNIKKRALDSKPAETNNMKKAKVEEPENRSKRKREDEVAVEQSKKFKYESDRSEIADNMDPKWALYNFPDATQSYQAVANRWSTSSTLKLNQNLSNMWNNRCSSRYQKNFGNQADELNCTSIYDEYLKIIKSKLNILKRDLNEKSYDFSAKTINCLRNKCEQLKNTAHAIESAKQEMDKFYFPLTTKCKINSYRKNEAIEINRIIDGYEAFYNGS